MDVFLAFYMAETTFYCGCPVRCEGITVASLCCYGISQPEGWSKKDVKAIEGMAKRIGAVLEKEAQAKKFQTAQQAMMMQMMQMQMQGMPGMMMPMQGMMMPMQGMTMPMQGMMPMMQGMPTPGA